MNRIKLFAASGIFVVLTFVKLLIPGVALAIRAEAHEIINSDTDYTQVINFISQRISGTGSDNAVIVSSDSNKETSYTDKFSPVTIDELRRVTASTVRERKIESEDSAENPQPEAVTAFLDSQAEFSDYAVPANVTYSLLEIPFKYAPPVSGYHSSGFGYRIHPITEEVKFHYGTDIAANSGDNILSFADGTVSFAGFCDSYGNYITIDHGNGWQTLYAHCSVLYVKSGDSVSLGDKIALVGATGQVTGPHLHFELTHNGVYVNPEYYVNYV